MQLGNFSPDGLQLTYSRDFRWKEAGNCCEDFSIMYYDMLSEMELLILPEAFNPAWSPNGDQIVFRSSFGINAIPVPGNIGIFDVPMDSVIQLTTGSNIFQRPVWHPDGNQIIFLSDIADQNVDYWEVMKYDLATEEWGSFNESGSLKVINGPMSFSPDGKKLAFMDYAVDYKYNIHYFDVEKQASETEFKSIWNDLNPSYSPDGKYMAFISDRSGKTEIWVKDLSSRKLTQLTGELVQTIDSELTWSKDSQQIYFKSYLENIYGIYYLDI
jgi:Tol biopolymer transport system component